MSQSIRPRYRNLVPNVVKAGPTSFAPIIHEAIKIVNNTGGFHILVIIADGQVTRSVDIPRNAVSKNEKETIFTLGRLRTSWTKKIVELLGITSWYGASRSCCW